MQVWNPDLIFARFDLWFHIPHVVVSNPVALRLWTRREGLNTGLLESSVSLEDARKGHSKDSSVSSRVSRTAEPGALVSIFHESSAPVVRKELLACMHVGDDSAQLPRG